MSFLQSCWLVLFILVNFLTFLILDSIIEDVSTDGKWCYIVFWVIGKPNTRLGLLKKRLIGACPSCYSASGISYYWAELQPPRPPDVFLLKISCNDQRGLLHGKLWILCAETFTYCLAKVYFCWLQWQSQPLKLVVSIIYRRKKYFLLIILFIKFKIS